ncbi:MAG: hypothetical protein P4L83_07720 [Nevskia sp.]|nr:hypothetical protein [Nevskia sp.]
MLNQVRVSGWLGPIRHAAASAVLAAMTAGCAALPFDTGPTAEVRAADDLQFLAQAMEGGASVRQAMWRQVQAAPRGTDSNLRLALLQSVPDHANYDPLAAQRSLRAVLAQNPPEPVAALARVRLDELRSSTQCLGETQDLRRRLSQVVEIERQINQRGP